MKIDILTRQGIKEINGKIITYKNTDFGIPYKNMRPDHEFTHIASGNGFTGNGKMNLDSLKSVEKRIGIKKFWKVIKSQKTIEEGLKKNKAIEEYNSTFHDKIQLLNKETGLRLKQDMGISLITGKLSIDVFNLESQLKNMGYNDDGMSIDGFITEKWSKRISKRIKKLI